MGGLYVNNQSTATDFFNARILDYFGKQVMSVSCVPNPNVTAP